MSNNKYDITVKVNSLLPIGKRIKKLFYCILNDYVKRFDCKDVLTGYTLEVSLVHYPEQSLEQGLAILPTEKDTKRIGVQLRDPILNEWEMNPIVAANYVGCMCHEFVHVCQFLTKRRGFKIPKAKYDKESETEAYGFDSIEVEARVFEGIYVSLYGWPLIKDFCYE